MVSRDDSGRHDRFFAVPDGDVRALPRRGASSGPRTRPGRRHADHRSLLGGRGSVARPGPPHSNRGGTRAARRAHRLVSQPGGLCAVAGDERRGDRRRPGSGQRDRRSGPAYRLPHAVHRVAPLSARRSARDSRGRRACASASRRVRGDQPVPAGAAGNAVLATARPAVYAVHPAVPLVPLAVWFDGTVSCLRTYTAEELHDLVGDLQQGYDWEIGTVRSAPLPSRITYLLGQPRS